VISFAYLGLAKETTSKIHLGLQATVLELRSGTRHCADNGSELGVLGNVCVHGISFLEHCAEVTAQLLIQEVLVLLDLRSTHTNNDSDNRKRW
jgi:hypothetical protein